jgi:hypothetical protein
MGGVAARCSPLTTVISGSKIDISKFQFNHGRGPQVYQLIQLSHATLVKQSCLLYLFIYITPLLKDLHWLPVNQRIVFKILLLVYKVLHQIAPSYLIEPISVLPSSAYNLRRNNHGILLKVSCNLF